MRTTSFVFMLVFAGLLTAALWFGADQWSQILTQTPAHANLVRIVAVTLYAEGVAIVPLTLIRMQERSGVFVAITITRFAVTIGLSLAFVVALGWGVRGALEANAASALVVLVVLLPDYVRALHGRPSWALLREMLAFGLPFFPVILSSWFIEASDRYLLGLFRTHAEVGWYVLGYKVAQVMQVALAAFTMGWAPLRYRIHERPDAGEVYRRLTSFYMVAAGMLTVAVAVFAREIVSIISPHSYAPAASIVPLIAAGYALNGLYVLMVTGMGVAKKTAPMAWVVGGAAVANVGINLILIPLWGMHAAAVTTVLANVIMVAGCWWYSQRVYPIPYDWPRILRIAAIGVVVVAASVWLAPGRGVEGVAAAGLAWLVFAALLVMTRTIPATEVSRVVSSLRTLRPDWRSRSTREELAR
jgi:O-antigen/teichoic acid export membrane protein